MSKKKSESNVIKEPPDEKEVVIDYSFCQSVASHIEAFGFESILINIIEAYRKKARRYNAEANKLEQALKDSQ